VAHRQRLSRPRKNLVRDRFERSGMRWTPTMAEAMLKLRAVYLSDDADAYWDWHVPTGPATAIRRALLEGRPKVATPKGDHGLLV
jgi:hypothetical protein